jgi:hypothetical protein
MQNQPQQQQFGGPIAPKMAAFGVPPDPNVAAPHAPQLGVVAPPPGMLPPPPAIAGPAPAFAAPGQAAPVMADPMELVNLHDFTIDNKVILNHFSIPETSLNQTVPRCVAEWAVRNKVDVSFLWSLRRLNLLVDGVDSIRVFGRGKDSTCKGLLPDHTLSSMYIAMRAHIPTFGENQVNDPGAPDREMIRVTVLGQLRAAIEDIFKQDPVADSAELKFAAEKKLAERLAEERDDRDKKGKWTPAQMDERIAEVERLWAFPRNGAPTIAYMFSLAPKLAKGEYPIFDFEKIGVAQWAAAPHKTPRDHEELFLAITAHLVAMVILRRMSIDTANAVAAKINELRYNMVDPIDSDTLMLMYKRFWQQTVLTLGNRIPAAIDSYVLRALGTPDNWFKLSVLSMESFFRAQSASSNAIAAATSPPVAMTLATMPDLNMGRPTAALAGAPPQARTPQSNRKRNRPNAKSRAKAKAKQFPVKVEQAPKAQVEVPRYQGAPSAKAASGQINPKTGQVVGVCDTCQKPRTDRAAHPEGKYCTKA